MDFISLSEIIFVPIAVALITATGSSVAMIISARKNIKKFEHSSQTFRTENTIQHNENKVILQHLSTQVGNMDHKIDRLDHRLDNVQIWQAEHEKEHLNLRDSFDMRD